MRDFANRNANLTAFWHIFRNKSSAQRMCWGSATKDRDKDLGNFMPSPSAKSKSEK